jgi:hypothetical protein
MPENRYKRGETKMYATKSEPLLVEELGYVEYDRQTMANRERLFEEDATARLNGVIRGRWVTEMVFGIYPIRYQVTRVYKTSVQLTRCYGIGDNDVCGSDDKTTANLSDVAMLIRQRDALRVDIGVVL